jgi:hypothetical protein
MKISPMSTDFLTQSIDIRDAINKLLNQMGHHMNENNSDDLLAYPSELLAKIEAPITEVIEYLDNL